MRNAMWMLAVTFAVAANQANAAVPPIALVKDAKPKDSVFENAQWNKPTLIKTEEEAARHFDKEALASLKKQVNFKEQQVLLFAWKGSGGDKLEYAVAESFPEQIFFSYKAGRTDDIKSHVFVYALRSNVTWKVREGK